MGANLNAVVHASIEDELCVFKVRLRAFNVLVFWVMRGFEYAEEALNDMVAMNIKTKLLNIGIELLNYHH